jgi:hypothetical protein
VTLQLDRAGKRMDVTSRRPTGEMQACDQLAG